jgi:uncharacterized protein (TIRG00374 family)
MKRLHTILLGLGFALLVFLLWKVGRRELWRQVASLGWGILPLMLGEGVAEFIHTAGWRHCLSGRHRSLSLVSLFRIRLAGYAINYLTPTAALGGEVTKGALLSAHGRGPDAASGVLIGKLCFAAAHLLFVVLGALLLFPRVHFSGTFLKALLLCGMVVGAGILIFLFLQQQGKLGALVRWLAARKSGSSALQKAARELTAVDEAMMRFYRERPRDLMLAISWHLVGYSIGIAQTWLFFHLLHQDASWMLAAVACFLGMWFDLLTFAVPMNLGTLEGSRILGLQALGYTTVMGMTYGLALRSAQVFWASLGLLNYALLVRNSRRSSEVSLPIGWGRGEGTSTPWLPLRKDRPELFLVESRQKADATLQPDS